MLGFIKRRRAEKRARKRAEKRLEISRQLAEISQLGTRWERASSFVDLLDEENDLTNREIYELCKLAERLAPGVPADAYKILVLRGIS